MMPMLVIWHNYTYYFPGPLLYMFYTSPPSIYSPFLFTLTTMSASVTDTQDMIKHEKTYIQVI
jgi:hypothetical protein